MKEKLEKDLKALNELFSKVAEHNMQEWCNILKKMKKDQTIFITTANLTDLDSDLLENIITENPINANNLNVQKLKNLTSNILKNPGVELQIGKNWFILDKNMIPYIIEIDENSDDIEILKIKKLNDDEFDYVTQLSSFEIKKFDTTIKFV